VVTLEPMTQAGWERWLADAIRGYAADKVRVGAWPARDAEARSAREFADLLPDGRDTPGHDLRSIVNEAGEPVGVLWFAPADGLSGNVAFIYDLEIEAAFRGRGYGRAALAALEPLARDLGFDSIGLHVFGDNEVARTLYRTSGYVETDVTMRKRLG
jgi:GNAT superfamily N-acetyltransferase